MAEVNAAVSYALAQVGKPYCWGGIGPNCYDCSGLVQQAYLHAGVQGFPRIVPAQMAWCWAHNKIRPPRDQLVVGDLVAPYPSFEHIQMYIGNGQVVEAPHEGANVRVIKMWGFWQAARVLPGGYVDAGWANNSALNPASGCTTPTAAAALTLFGLVEVVQHIWGVL